MKYQKLTDKLNDLLELTGREEDKKQENLNKYFWRLRAEEQKLHKKIKNENDKTSRKRLKKKLKIVNEGYDLLGSQLNNPNSN